MALRWMRPLLCTTFEMLEVIFVLPLGFARRTGDGVRQMHALVFHALRSIDKLPALLYFLSICMP
jgi:hypothetical protein